MRNYDLTTFTKFRANIPARGTSVHLFSLVTQEEDVSHLGEQAGTRNSPLRTINVADLLSFICLFFFFLHFFVSLYFYFFKFNILYQPDGSIQRPRATRHLRNFSLFPNASPTVAWWMDATEFYSQCCIVISFFRSGIAHCDPSVLVGNIIIIIT